MSHAAIICVGCAADIGGQIASNWRNHANPCDVCGEAHPTCRHARTVVEQIKAEADATGG